jgi:hypothetical protein
MLEDGQGWSKRPESRNKRRAESGVGRRCAGQSRCEIRWIGGILRPSGKTGTIASESSDAKRRDARPPGRQDRRTGRVDPELTCGIQDQACITLHRRQRMRPSHICHQDQQKDEIRRSVESLHNLCLYLSRNCVLSLAFIPGAAKPRYKPRHIPAPGAPRNNPSPFHSASASASPLYPGKPSGTCRLL